MTDWREALLDRQTPTTWSGIECGDGWRPLVEFLYNQVEQRPCLKVAQVKEKYGGLRFYTDHDYECEESGECKHLISMYHITDAIEALSYHICEVCGKRGEVGSSAWVRTLCDEHRAEE